MKGDRTIHPRVLDYAYTGTNALYKEFHISQKGYSDEQVEDSRGQYGKNILSGRAYDMLCLVLPWDNVDEEACAQPLEWSGRTLGRFMRLFGPISSIFDLLTFAFLFFVLCPTVCHGSFASLAGSEEQLRFIALFQTGWFLESMWTQVLILHLLRTKKVPLLQSRPSRPVMLVTTLGILFFTILTFTPMGHLIGLAALPIPYFIFEISLTPKEFDILYFLARNRGEVFTKEQIYQAVWEHDYLMDDSNIMAFIRKLRKKIEPNPDAPEYILTIWGIGYKFNDKL